MKVQEIREIIKLISQSTINEFEFEQEGTKIKIKRGTAGSVAVQEAPIPAVPVIQQAPPAPVAPAAVETKPEAAAEKPAQEDANYHKIISPMVGTFYASSSPEADAFVKVGDRVTEDSIVCIVEAMKLFNEIEAEVNGEIVEILVKNGQLVEYGQPLFLVKAE